MAFRFKELEGKMGKIIDNIISRLEPVLVKKVEKEYEIWLEPDFLHIEDLKLNIYMGYHTLYDEEQDDYNIDADIYKFYDDETGKEVYYEIGSSLGVCLHNYLYSIGKDDINIDNLLCTFRLDKGKFLREKVIDSNLL